MTKAISTRQRLIDMNARSIRREIVEIPVEGEDPIRVEVRSPTLGQSAQFSDDSTGRGRQMAKIVIACAFDADSGEPLFTEADEDLILEGPTSGSWVTAIVTKMSELVTAGQVAAKN